MRPLVVAETPAAYADAVRAARASGAVVVEGWRGRAGVVCCGEVADAEEAAAALLAAVAGACVVVEARATREIIDRLVDDLRRLGPVTHIVRDPPRRTVLTPDERRLVELLARGASLGEAAAQLHLARRTADRRLAAARAKLGVSTTAEAIVAARRLGLVSSD